MWRAALPCTQYRLVFVGLVLAAVLAGAGLPASHPEAAAPGQVWAVALPANGKSVSPAHLKWLASRGVTTVVAFNAPKRSLPKLAAAAARAKLAVIVPMARAPKSPCKPARGSLRTCAAVAPTAVAAVKLARRSLVDYVVVRIKTPRQLRMLRGSSAKRSRIVALLPLNARADARAAWRAGITYAAADPVLDVGVASATSTSTSPLLDGYLSDLPKTRKAAGAGPAAPGSLIVVGRTSSTVSLRWGNSPGSAGYGVYTDGAFVLNLDSRAITLTGLQCARTYAFAVDAYDAAGVRSARTSISTSTDICPGGSGGGGSAADSVAPSAPAGLARTSATQTGIVVSWSAASDNVAVAGYGLYRGGSLVGSSAVTSYSFSGLTCGTSYSLAVDAYDAAGNRSSRTTISASTSACSSGGDTSAPSAPGSLARTSSTTTSISVSWNASSDNVGVTGYGLYRNGASTGSTASRSATFGSLACGTSYTLGVDAYDAAGNRSTRTNLTTATSACPASTDTQRPSVPQGLGFGTITATSVALVWNASVDNVGVAGYRLSRNGATVTTVPSPGYTYTGLTCGTAYSFMVEAYDAAGNFSIGAEAVASTSTLACSGGGTPPPPPPPPTGSASVYLSPSGSDSAACTAAAPCRSFARAYTVAASGAVVSVGAGLYGPQLFAGGFGGTQGRGTKQVAFRGEPGNAIRMLHFDSPNLTFDGIHVDGGGIKLGGGDGALFENGGEPFTFSNGSIGNVVDQKGAMINGAGMVFDNVRFHDVVIQTSGVHSECIFASVPEGMIVRNSTFFNCAVMDIFFVYPDWWSPLPPVYGNVVLEGNTFGRPDGTYTLYIAKIGTSIPSSAPVNGWRIRNNYFESAVNIDAPIGTGNIFCGNTGSVSASWKTSC